MLLTVENKNRCSFLQDDYRCNLKYGIIEKDMDPVCPLDMAGRFTADVADFKGLHVKVQSVFC